MHHCAAAVNRGHYLKSGVTADLAHGTNGATGLFEPYIPWPWCGAGAKKYAFFTFHQRLREAGRVTHHSVNYAVEEQFHLPGDVAPIAGGSHNDGIGILNHLEDALGIVLGQQALAFCAAGHTACARFDLKIVGADRLYNMALRLSIFLHNAQHPGQHSIFLRTSVYYQYFHSTNSS